MYDGSSNTLTHGC